MYKFYSHFIGEGRRRAVLILLGSLSIIASIAVVSKIGYVHGLPGLIPGFDAPTIGIGLIWNIFLAWIPLLVGLVIYERARQNEGILVTLLLLCIWLLFYPNAPYILSDLIHLGERRGHIYQFDPSTMLFWVDLIMLSLCAWVGMLLGYVALYLVQNVVARWFGALNSWLIVIAVSFLSAFGVYLGRFSRWNSWDIIAQPVALLSSILDYLLHPLTHSEVLIFTLIFGLFHLAIYIVLYGIVHIFQGGSNLRFEVFAKEQAH